MKIEMKCRCGATFVGETLGSDCNSNMYDRADEWRKEHKNGCVCVSTEQPDKEEVKAVNTAEKQG